MRRAGVARNTSLSRAPIATNFVVLALNCIQLEHSWAYGPETTRSANRASCRCEIGPTAKGNDGRSTWADNWTRRAVGHARCPLACRIATMLRIPSTTVLHKLALILWSAVATAAPSEAGDLCVVPVENGTPTAADLGQTWRMVSAVNMIPGIPRPIIGPPLDREGVWTIDRHRAFVRFPVTWSIEASTGRIIGYNFQKICWRIRATSSSIRQLALRVA